MIFYISMAESLGVNCFSGESFEPCQLCYDRSSRLQDLESRMMISSEDDEAFPESSRLGTE